MLIPTQIVDFSIYNGKDKLLGTGSEVKLPTITSKTYTADLAAGEIDVPGMRTENMELEVPFNVFDDEAADTISLSKVTKIVIRGCSQKLSTSSHDFKYNGLKVTAQGFCKELDLGTLKRSDGMDSKIKLTLTYIKVENEKGVKYIEIDKLNGTYIVNGVNQRKGMSKYL